MLLLRRGLKNSRDERKLPHGDLPKIPTGHRLENEAHDGSVHRCAGAQTESSPDLPPPPLGPQNAEKGEGVNAAKGVQIASLLYDAAVEEQASKTKHDQD
ncbi:hypothetical protein VE04_10357 [Pseudogymnoascus sp. 24MN13]|nr:hypothetical protein VE04_10357 [Pseudogymnoascus sp. 24MN13]